MAVSMGICSSCESTSIPMAKLLQLQEFSKPVKVSHVLQGNLSCFICNSDRHGPQRFCSVVNANEELQLGQLYFVLPLSRLQYSFKVKKMAALAVKPCSALMKIGSVKCGCRLKIAPVAAFGQDAGGHRKNKSGFQRDEFTAGSSQRRKPARRRPNSALTAKLGTIQEGCD